MISSALLFLGLASVSMAHEPVNGVCHPGWVLRFGTTDRQYCVKSAVEGDFSPKNLKVFSAKCKSTGISSTGFMFCGPGDAVCPDIAGYVGKYEYYPEHDECCRLFKSADDVPSGVLRCVRSRGYKEVQL